MWQETQGIIRTNTSINPNGNRDLLCVMPFKNLINVVSQILIKVKQLHMASLSSSLSCFKGTILNVHFELQSA